MDAGMRRQARGGPTPNIHLFTPYHPSFHTLQVLNNLKSSLNSMVTSGHHLNKTIAVRMKGGGYKRIDLLNKCSGLKIQGGFSHATSTNDLCTTDPLRVLEPVGSTCMIDKIVTIDAAEYKELRKRK